MALLFVAPELFEDEWRTDGVGRARASAGTGGQGGPVRGEGRAVLGKRGAGLYDRIAARTN